MAKKLDPHDPYNPAYRDKVPLVQPPFRIIYFHNKIFPGRVGRTEKCIEQMQKGMFVDKYKKISQVEYIILMLQIGDELQICLELLERERILKLNRLLPAIEFTDHPLIRHRIFPDYIKGVDSKNKMRRAFLSDGNFLTWHTVLIDLIFQLSEHVRAFSTFVLAHQIPSYAALRRESSTPE